MTFIYDFLSFISTPMTVPKSYETFHLTMFGIMTVVAIIFALVGKRCLEKTFRRIVLWWWIINVILELYFILIYSYTLSDGEINWGYQWYMFPFQLCTSPAYTLPFVALLKDGKVRDAFIAYTMSFAFFGGFAVMLYPGDVFMHVAGINVQTMIHHGMQAVMGIFFAVHERHRLTRAFFARGIWVFVGLLTIAMALNVGGYHIMLNNGTMHTFNMFYISPYFPCTLPVLSMIYPLVPYPVFLAIYIFGFVLIAWLMFVMLRAFARIGYKKCKA